MTRPAKVSVNLHVSRHNGGNTKPVTGYALPVPGLVATRPLVRDLDKPDFSHQAKLGWLITHAESGCKVSGRRAKTLADAASIAQDLADLGLDWTLDASGIKDAAIELCRFDRHHHVIDAVWDVFDSPPCGVRTLGTLF